MTYQRHFLSAAWPDMSDEDQRALRDSIGASGLREPIVLLNGEILDGWQRYTACLAEGVEPRFEEFAGEDGEEAADFVRDKHTRRPLTLTQRLVSVMQMSRYKPPHRPIKSADSADLSELPQRSASEIAKSVGASTRSAESVKAALDHGAPALVQAMRAGTVAAHKAEAIARLPVEEQAAALFATKPAKFQGKPKKGPKADVLRAELKAAGAKQDAQEALTQVQALQQENATLREALEATQDELNLMLRCVERADDPLKAAIADAKSSQQLARGLQARVNSLVNEVAEAKRSAEHWKRKAGQTA